MPLAQQAWTLGFAVTVVDVRNAYDGDRFQARLVSAHFSVAESVPLGAGIRP